jgi:hypothetical protein
MPYESRQRSAKTSIESAGFIATLHWTFLSSRPNALGAPLQRPRRHRPQRKRTGTGIFEESIERLSRTGRCPFGELLVSGIRSLVHPPNYGARRVR